MSKSSIWEQMRAGLDGLPGGQGLNIAYEAVDRHVAHGFGERAAIRWMGKAGAARDISYAELSRRTNQVANALTALGVGAQDRVFVLAPRLPELYETALGVLKNRSVFCPLFAAFGPEPIRTRLEKGSGKILVTTESLYRKKVAGIRDALPGLEHVLLIGAPGQATRVPGTLDYHEVVDAASTSFSIAPTGPEDMALLHFTSGTTGTPKGAVHVHAAVIMHFGTGRDSLGLRPDDVFWCTADPGWVTGTSYGIIAPLTNGVTNLVDEGEFDVERWYELLEQRRVTVWYTAPTAIRMLMRAGTEVAKKHDLSSLRFIASVGEPLNPEAVVWGQRAFGMPIHDNWWQTETGGIMIANVPGMEVRPGSMGKPLPGVSATIVHVDERGVREAAVGECGELALVPGWPSMFRGYLDEPARYQKCFRDGFYLTGDLARRDADGYFWFVGRADDVIKTAGHLVGPFEIESALMEHPAVAEAAAIGMPDPVAMNVIKAFVLLRPNYFPSDELGQELLGFARKRLGAAIAPKDIVFAQSLPKTRSGKIMRRLLRARELGLPEGDTSTLEGGSA
ncbi:MAG TPA: acetate--CoA ligase [Polyangiaceae bacterium]|nr:acetate--CoA ligase [Polyangiaceae bacterium]